LRIHFLSVFLNFVEPYNQERIVRQRYLSLDVFRGATVAFMILVNNPGTWSHIFDPLEHASWHGLTPTDLVFPFFLFAVGNAMAFVMPRLRAAGDFPFWKKIIQRSALIFLIGTFLNWFPFAHWVNGELVFRGWEWTMPDGELRGIRVLGTLQRIAICYFFASIIVYYTKTKTAAVISAVTLLLYWLVTILMNPSDPFSFEGWFGKTIDFQVLGENHVYRGDGIPFENEGLVSTIPAIIQVITGFMVGDFIRQRTLEDSELKISTTTIRPLYRTLTHLFVAATLLLLVGYIWSLFFPINKKIQSSSFILITAGLATVIISTLIYLIEVNNKSGWWTSFFNVFGKNPLFIYALSELVPRLARLVRIPNGLNSGETLYVSPLTWFYENICALLPGPPEIGSVFYAICIVMLYWCIGYWMNKRNIIITV
jgi:predicted acyltransferase